MGARIPLLLVFFLMFLMAWSASAQAPSGKPGTPHRLALLVGSGGYLKMRHLGDVSGDINQMKSALEDAGFRVSVSQDLQKDMPAFFASIQPGDVCFFYFAGYAVQSQQENYLLPLDFDPAKPQDLGAVPSLTGIQQLLDDSKAGVKMLVLEASRQNDRLLGQGGVGLASPDVGSSNQILFAFSAAQNQLAADDSGTFTKYVAEAIRKKGMTLDELFNEVRDKTSAATNGTQKIFFQNYISKDFKFHEAEKKPDLPPVTVAAPPAPVPAPLAGRKAGTLATNHKDREDYVWIPAGSFKMGCVPGDTKCKSEEKPQHSVKISQGFWMGRNEVQTGSYQRFVDEDKKSRKMPARAPVWDSKWKLGNYPIVLTSWEESQGYCEWAGGRLPTEAQWEYAARGGKEDETYPLNDENSRDKANFYGTKGNDRWEQAAPVRSFDQNPFGLFDMAGNVWEWCADLFSKTYYGESPADDPKGPSGGPSDHTVRGGSWYSDPKQHLRISYRETKTTSNTVGFRCVLPDVPATDDLLKAR